MLSLLGLTVIGVTVLVLLVVGIVRFFSPPSWEDHEDPEPENFFQAAWQWWRHNWWWW
jgi:broad specificity phosphatase PhoE